MLSAWGNKNKNKTISLKSVRVLGNHFSIVLTAVLCSLAALPVFGQTGGTGTPAGIQYVSPNGLNSNSGGSWGTAKASISSALDALPTTGGTITLAAGVYVLTSPITLGSSSRTVNLVLKQGALIKCDLKTSGSCLNLAYSSTIQGPSHGLANPTNIEAVRGSSMASVIGTSVATKQGPAAHLDNIRITLEDGSTITNSAIDVCSQENGASFLQFSVHDFGALGTHSLLHIDGTCNGAPVSNGVGYIQDASLECHGTQGCTPLDVQGAPAVLTFNWIMTNVVTEAAGDGNPDVYFDGSRGPGEEFLIDGLHVETSRAVGSATGPAILIDHMANVAIIDPYIGYHGLSRTDVVDAIKIQNTSRSERWSNVYVRNIHATANGVAATINTVDNTVSGHIVNACRYGCDTASYTWANSAWNGAHPSYFDGLTPEVDGIPLGVVSAGRIVLSDGSGSHTFTVPYHSSPVCTATDATRAAVVRVTSTTTTVSVSGSGDDRVTWICAPTAN